MSNLRTLIIVLHFRSIEDTLACIESLCQCITSPFDIFLVNTGTDETVDSIIRAKYPDVIYHYAGVETGFAAGNNVGLRYGLEHNYTYLLLLNNDTVANTDFLSPLQRALQQDPAVALIGPAIYYYDDRERLWSCGGRIRRLTGRLGGITDLNELPSDLSDVDYLPGACILVRNDALKKIGLMCEEYFLGVEESDWATQARRYGLRVVAFRKAELLHKVGISSYATPELVYNGLRNRFLFLQRQFSPVIAPVLIFRLFIYLLLKHWRDRQLCWRALVDHYKYRTIRRRHLDSVRQEFNPLGRRQFDPW